MSALLQTIVSLVLKLPDGLLIRLSGRPQEVRGHRKLLPTFQLLCSAMEKSAAPIETLSPPEARAFQENAPIDFDPLPRPAPTTRDHSVPVEGGEVTVREYEPPGASGALPTLVYFHGGGWVLGNIDLYDGLCSRLAMGGGCRVFSVNYRLAPEHPFPVPLRDCEAAFEWVIDHAAQLGADPARIAAGGDSAGGNLTAALCISRKAAGKPLPCLQLLIYPVTDFAFATVSFEECGEGLFLSRKLMEWFRDHYLPDESEWKNPLASPLLEPDLSGHPPAVVVTAGFDPLRDEGDAYARRLEDAGVNVTHRSHDSLIHGFANMGFVREARSATEEIATLLGKQFA